jgi:bifunctional enzyme CysN/CysC
MSRQGPAEGQVRIDAAGPLRLQVRSLGEARLIAVDVLSGTPAAGAEVVVLPAARSARITALETTRPGLLIGLEPAHEIEAGAIIAAAAARPEIADQVAATLAWSGTKPMLPGRRYLVDLAGQRATATVTALKHVLDPETNGHIAARRMTQGEAGVCNLSFDRPLVFDPYETCPATGSFRLLDRTSAEPVGSGRIVFALRRASNIHWQKLEIDRAARAGLKGQRPCCLWFTGLSGSGKSTVASLIEKRLHALGRHTYVLDGDNVRHGLNKDLGFSPEDRTENIRRIGEVAKLFTESGTVTITAFISPYRDDRNQVRALMSDGDFHEVFVDCALDVCEQRDPKGLYKKARAGQIPEFTGISAPYEAPEKPELVIPSDRQSVAESVGQLIRHLEKTGIIPAAR